MASGARWSRAASTGRPRCSGSPRGPASGPARCGRSPRRRPCRPASRRRASRTDRRRCRALLRDRLGVPPLLGAGRDRSAPFPGSRARVLVHPRAVLGAPLGRPGELVSGLGHVASCAVGVPLPVPGRRRTHMARRITRSGPTLTLRAVAERIRHVAFIATGARSIAVSEGRRLPSVRSHPSLDRRPGRLHSPGVGRVGPSRLRGRDHCRAPDPDDGLRPIDVLTVVAVTDVTPSVRRVVLSGTADRRGGRRPDGQPAGPAGGRSRSAVAAGGQGRAHRLARRAPTG